MFEKRGGNINETKTFFTRTDRHTRLVAGVFLFSTTTTFPFEKKKAHNGQCARTYTHTYNIRKNVYRKTLKIEKETIFNKIIYYVATFTVKSETNNV